MVWKSDMFLIENSFLGGQVDTTLFRKYYWNDFILLPIYVNEIIFSATNEFEISMKGELKFFPGLQIKQSNNQILSMRHNM